MIRQWVWFFLFIMSGNLFADNKTIHIGNLSDPHTLNPFQVATSDSAFVAKNLYESLVVINSDGKIIPGQAESWNIEDNGKRLVFHLHEGLKWSNGQPLVAEDFVAGFRYQIDPANAFHDAESILMLRVVNAKEIASGQKAVDTLGVSAPDQRTVVFELSTPVEHALYLLVGRYPLYRSTREKPDRSWAKVGQMVVNGAYTPEEWILNERIVLRRNPHYRDVKNVKIEKAVLYPLAQETELKQYEAGQLDITGGTVTGRYSWMVKRFGSQFRINTVPGLYFYIFNHANSKFKDKRIRQALSYAIDRQRITSKVTGYGEQPAVFFLPPNPAEGRKPETLLSSLTQKQLEEKARDLYREAGYGPDNPLEIEILYNTMESHRKIALATADMWKRILGVKVILRNMEWNALQSGLKQGDFSIVRMGWAMGNPNPCFLLPLFRSDSHFNSWNYKNESYDRYVDQACYSPDIEQRREALVNAEQLMADDMPAIPIYHYIHARLVKERVKGYPRSDQYNFFLIKDLYFE